MNIEVLYEEESSVIIGFWAKGHHSTKDFIDRAEIEFDLEDKPIDPRDVALGWVTQITDEEIVGDFDYYWGFSKEPKEHSKKATYFFYE